MAGSRAARYGGGLFSLLLAGLAVILALAVVELPQAVPSLEHAIRHALPNTGVSNPVTAVLLNFRSYDTLLEIAVLLVALLGLERRSRRDPLRWDRVDSPVLDGLVRLLAPLLILMAGYLLWVGAHAPGGAFQGGAVLAATGVLYLLSGRPVLTALPRLLLRILVVLGLTAFLLVGLISAWGPRLVLQYPEAWAGMLILVIEAASVLAIATILVVLFMGVVPDDERSGHDATRKRGD